VAGGPGAGLLDAQALARLQELDPHGQAGLVRRVLLTYAQSLRRLLDQVRTARAAGDREALGQVAHTLKSSSASVGALDLSALCVELEAQLRQPGHADAVPLAAMLERLQAEGERLLAGLQAP
jgi:HPt (histidine-containing phosphotransfer) domain-containing protein